VIRQRPLSEKDRRLVFRLATALAEHAGQELDAKHYDQASRVLTRRGAPLHDRRPGDVDVEAMIS
jgi:hypothetical protein